MRIVVVEDHVAFRESFAVALAVRGGFTVVGQGASGREACRLIEQHRPDVLCVDLMLTDTDGVALLRELRRQKIRQRALVLSRISHPLFVQDAFRAGALGYALKDDSLDEIIRGLQIVARGERYLSPAVSSAEEVASGALAELSAREREVFCRLLDGLTAKEIAKALCVSVKTVHAHRLKINRKLGVRSPVQLTRFAAEQGLL